MHAREAHCCCLCSSTGEVSFGDGEESEDDEDGAAERKRKPKKQGGFQAMQLSKPIFSGIMRLGYKLPTPIQRKALPLALAGRDVVAMARTGA